MLAVGYLHSKGIAHRDIKMENILMDEHGYIKLIDYGFAKRFAGDEKDTVKIGTPEYMAPEIYARTGHDFAVDWWAVGVLIFEMMFAVTPFYAKQGPAKVEDKIRRNKVTFPNRKRYHFQYSSDCEDLIK